MVLVMMNMREPQGMFGCGTKTSNSKLENRFSEIQILSIKSPDRRT